MTAGPGRWPDLTAHRRAEGADRGRAATLVWFEAIPIAVLVVLTGLVLELAYALDRYTASRDERTDDGPPALLLVGIGLILALGLLLATRLAVRGARWALALLICAGCGSGILGLAAINVAALTPGTADATLGFAMLCFAFGGILIGGSVMS